MLVKPDALILLDTLAVLNHAEQELRPLALLGGRHDGRHRPCGERSSELRACAPDQLGGGVLRDPQRLADLLVGAPRHFSQREHLAMARRELGVRLAHGLLRVAQESGPLGVRLQVGDAPALGGRTV